MLKQLAFGIAGVRGVQRVLRPATDEAPAFEISYVRTGPVTATPTVVIPGGPGLGSLLPYGGLRRWGASGGLDLIMVEHRGVGLSRNDLSGQPLPRSAMRITDVVDDIAAVLDHEQVSSAFIAGSSYGSYLASTFGVRHPEQVAGMLLDSALQSTEDLALERAVLRGLFWDAADDVAAAVRQLVGLGINQHRLLDVVRAAYELGGYELLRPLLQQRLAHPCSPTWKMLEVYSARDESIARIPGYYEFDIAGTIGFRELHYGAPLDGLPLDPAGTYAPLAGAFPAFAGEPYDLPAETPRFDWPMVLLAGARDLRTPPAIAQRVADTARDAVLVDINNGHSALDTHPIAMLNAIRGLALGYYDQLPGMAAKLDRLPRRGVSARLPSALMASLRLRPAG